MGTNYLFGASVYFFYCICFLLGKKKKNLSGLNMCIVRNI